MHKFPDYVISCDYGYTLVSFTKWAHSFIQKYIIQKWLFLQLRILSSTWVAWFRDQNWYWSCLNSCASKKRSTFTCIKSLNRYNLRHNNCVIFFYISSFLSNSFSCKFVHAIIFLFIEGKSTSCLSVELPKIYQYWSCLIILWNRVQSLINELLIKKSSVIK